MILAVTNQKGGIGKTTTCLNLGAIAALDGKRTCLIDLDPQGNLTKTFIQLQEGQPTIYNLLNYSIPFPEVLIETSIKGLSIIPARSDLAGLERSGASDSKLPYRLREVLKSNAQDFDLMIIDTPPTLGALTINAMTAATHILIPIQPSYYPLQGTSDLIETYNLVKAKLNPTLKLLGVLITMYDPRTTLAKEAVDEIRKAFTGKVLITQIHRNVKLEESPAAGQSIFSYAPRSLAAEQYRAAYQELMKSV